MEPSSPSTAARSPASLWVALALVVILAAGAGFWLNQKIDSVQAAGAPREQGDVNETEQVVTGLQQAIAEIQGGRQKLDDQASQLQRAVAANQGERKLLADQLGALSQRVDALSSRVDALASASAEGNSATAQQPPSTNRRRR